MLTRALYRAICVPNAPAPYDRLLMKIFYPAVYTGSDVEHNTGILPVAMDGAPYPVVIFFNGSNVESKSYQWLAEALVQQGMVVVLFDYLNEVMSGAITLTAGVDIEAIKPAHYGSRPTVPTLRPILDALAGYNSEGPLKGTLNLTRVILGGHSAGGTMALHSANAMHAPEICAIFTFAAHTLPAAFFGYPAGQVISVADVPVLLLAGDNDGVIAASRFRYDTNTSVDPVELTYRTGTAGGRGDVYYIVLKDTGHFAITHPIDMTTGRHFLEETLPLDESRTREVLVDLIGRFIARHVLHDTSMELAHDAAVMSRFEQK